jgi:hypothetical protein
VPCCKRAAGIEQRSSRESKESRSQPPFQLIAASCYLLHGGILFAMKIKRKSEITLQIEKVKRGLAGVGELRPGSLSTRRSKASSSPVFATRVLGDCGRRAPSGIGVPALCRRHPIAVAVSACRPTDTLAATIPVPACSAVRRITPLSRRWPVRSHATLPTLR